MSVVGQPAVPRLAIKAFRTFSRPRSTTWLFLRAPAGASGAAGTHGAAGAGGGSLTASYYIGADISDQEPQPAATRANLLTRMLGA